MRYLTAAKRYRQLRDSVSEPAKGQGFGQKEWVLSRALCRYVRFDLKTVPKQQRGQALELLIRQWTPFDKTASYLLWDQDHAQVWAWDAGRVESAVRSRKIKSNNVTIIPETLLRRRMEKGVFLVSCMEGYEGQVWSDQSLIGSRWWPELPNSGEWINLQRDAGTLPADQSHEIPTAITAHLADKPWGKSAVLGKSVLDGRKFEAWAVPLVVLCLFAGTMWYGTLWINLQTSTDELDAEFQSLNKQTGPIIEARGKALESLSRIKQLYALDPYPNQISLMSKLAESLPQDGSFLNELEFTNGKLKITVTSPSKLVSSEYIKRFQSIEIFRNVQAVTTNNATMLALSMEVVPKSEMKIAEISKAPGKEEPAPALR